MQSDKKHISGLLITILTLLFLVVLLDYIFYNRLIYPKSGEEKVLIFIYRSFYPVMEKDYILRFFYAISVIIYVNVSPSMALAKDMKKDDRFIYISLSVVLSIVLILGFLKIPIYDIFIFPVLLIFHAIITAKAFSFIKQDFGNQDVFGINQSEKGKCVFKLDLAPTESLPFIVIPNANYGIIFEGGTGCGKSASGIKPIIASAAEQGYAGIVYDFNGNPNLESNPILTRCAYYGIRKRLEKQNHNPTEIETKLAFLNFINLEKSVRVNPFPKYVRTKLQMMNIASSMLKNLEKQWKERMDFWGQNAVQILTASLHTLQKRYPQYYDLAHAVAIVLSPHDKFLKFIAQDEEICRDFMPVYSAYMAKAEGQIAGAVSSAQSPVSKLDSPEIFWVLSKDELDLDITNKEHPTLLCIGNDPMLSEALSAVISAIVYICMGNMNQPGRVRSIFCFDEIPSIVLYKLDDFIATCRKYNVCCIFGVQTHEQFKRDYGDKSADTVRNTLGNFFFGSTGDIKTAEYYSNTIGMVKKVDLSYTDGDNSNSTSSKMNNEKAIQPRDVMSQPIGHFMGKILDGKPAFFNCQFDYFKEEDQDPDYFKNTDIPAFANYYTSQDPEHKKSAFESDIKMNYDQIYKDINQLFDETSTDENLEKTIQMVFKHSSHLNQGEKKQLMENLEIALGLKKVN